YRATYPPLDRRFCSASPVTDHGGRPGLDPADRLFSLWRRNGRGDLVGDPRSGADPVFSGHGAAFGAGHGDHGGCGTALPPTTPRSGRAVLLWFDQKPGKRVAHRHGNLSGSSGGGYRAAGDDLSHDATARLLGHRAKTGARIGPGSEIPVLILSGDSLADHIA